MSRQPFIVGESIDKFLGFLAGFFGSVLGLIATVVIMFIWAGNDPSMEVEQRRNHATSVSIWSGVGCFFPIVLFLVFVVLGIFAFGAATMR